MNWQGKAQISHQSKRQALNKLMKYVTSLWKHSVAAKTPFLVLMVLISVSFWASLGSARLGSFTREVIQTY